MSQTFASDRTAPWLTLLRRLTENVPSWTVMKSVDSALTGTGDVDSVAPLEAWPVVEREFRDWAMAHGLGPVIVCPHVPYVLHLVALDPERAFFYELDVNRRKIFLGSTLFYPHHLLPLSRMDDRGFRQVRPGAEGLIKLVQNGAKRGGRPDWDGIRKKRIAQLLASDPDGVREGARLFGRGADAVVAVAESVVRGEWNPRAMLAAEAWCVLRGLGDPAALVARARFRIVRRRCPVLRAVFQAGRQVPLRVVEREEWLRKVATAHTVYYPEIKRRDEGDQIRATA
ncbi:MAG: hypothetical protein JWL84_1664 [Rhodospirillales bacterium]|nr:hypothetical protein [Rhodospirillales bacterium]